MAANPRFFRALQLQRIASTSRKFSVTAPTTPTPLLVTPTILKSLPEHTPLLPILLSHHVPSKLAKACADRYDRYADKLRLDTETKLAPYLLDQNEGQPARVYTVFLSNYSRALRDWAQSILNAALRSLKRDSAELRNWEATYPPPLWLPSPPDQYPCFRKKAQSPCPFSPHSAPSYAFPTIYPPPLRPSPKIPSFQPTRTPATLSKEPSTLAPDLDSLCRRFTASLVISEPSTKPSRSKASIFSLPITLKNATDASSSCAGRLERSPPWSRTPRRLPTLKQASSAPLRKTAKPRRLSVPPSLPSTTPDIRPVSRKLSALASRPPSQFVQGALQCSDTTHHATLTVSTSSPSTGDQGICSYPDPSIPCYPQGSFSSTLDRTTPAQSPSGSPSGPTTPPTLLPDLFSEPIIVPSTPVYLSPRFSLMPIADPFLQFQSQLDYFSGPSPVSTFDDTRSTSVVAGGDLFSKGAFDTPLGFDQIFRDIPTSITSDIFASNFANAYNVS